MKNSLSLTEGRIEDIIHQKRSVSISFLESVMDTSFDLIFLAIDNLASEHKIRIMREKQDYTIFINVD